MKYYLVTEEELATLERQAYEAGLTKVNGMSTDQLELVDSKKQMIKLQCRTRPVPSSVTHVMGTKEDWVEYPNVEKHAVNTIVFEWDLRADPIKVVYSKEKVG